MNAGREGSLDTAREDFVDGINNGCRQFTCAGNLAADNLRLLANEDSCVTHCRPGRTNVSGQNFLRLRPNSTCFVDACRQELSGEEVDLSSYHKEGRGGGR